MTDGKQHVGQSGIPLITSGDITRECRCKCQHENATSAICPSCLCACDPKRNRCRCCGRG